MAVGAIVGAAVVGALFLVMVLSGTLCLVGGTVGQRCDEG